MQGYEIVTIVDPQIADEDVPNTSDKINEFITSRGGSVARVQRWGRRRLAYPIKRQMEAHYLLTTYELDPEHASELEADLVLAQEVLKHMVVKLDDEEFQRASEEPPAPVVVETPAEPAAPAQPAEAPVAEATTPEPAVAETAEPKAEATEPAAATTDTPEPETKATEPSAAVTDTPEPEAEATEPGPTAVETVEPVAEEGEGAEGESVSEPVEKKEGT